KLYRSVCRTLPGWKKVKNEIFDDQCDLSSIEIDPSFRHSNWKKYLEEAQDLYTNYKLELFEIMHAYGFNDEIDMFCCCESARVNSHERCDIQTTVQYLLKQLFEHTLKKFSSSVFQHNNYYNCPKCDRQMAKASACYVVCYSTAQTIKNKSERIMSFAWIFTKWLMKIQYQETHLNQHKSDIVGIAMRHYFQATFVKYKLLTCPIDQAPDQNKTYIFLKEINFGHLTVLQLPSIAIIFIEIIHNWLLQQNIFGNSCDDRNRKPLIRQSCWYDIMTRFILLEADYRGTLVPLKLNLIFEERSKQLCDDNWSQQDYSLIEGMFYKLLSVCFDRARQCNINTNPDSI
ncbi:unnamed protein product, partial [Didymodactylos carnosus]